MRSPRASLPKPARPSPSPRSTCARLDPLTNQSSGVPTHELPEPRAPRATSSAAPERIAHGAANKGLPEPRSPRGHLAIPHDGCTERLLSQAPKDCRNRHSSRSRLAISHDRCTRTTSTCRRAGGAASVVPISRLAVGTRGQPRVIATFRTSCRACRSTRRDPSSERPHAPKAGTESLRKIRYRCDNRPSRLRTLDLLEEF